MVGRVAAFGDSSCNFFELDSVSHLEARTFDDLVGGVGSSCVGIGAACFGASFFEALDWLLDVCDAGDSVSEKEDM